MGIVRYSPLSSDAKSLHKIIKFNIAKLDTIINMQIFHFLPYLVFHFNFPIFNISKVSNLSFTKYTHIHMEKSSIIDRKYLLQPKVGLLLGPHKSVWIYPNTQDVLCMLSVNNILQYLLSTQ